jgi:hypothetical protein
MQKSFVAAASLAFTVSALTLAAGCATTAAEAARGHWYAVSTPRFQVWTDGDPQLARGMVEDLERYHQVALRTTTAEDREAAPPVRIFLAKDSSSMGALAPMAKLAPGVIRAGIFTSTYRGNYAVVNSKDDTDAAGEQLTGRAVLFHEYAALRSRARSSRRLGRLQDSSTPSSRNTPTVRRWSAWRSNRARRSSFPSSRFARSR